MCPHSYSRKCLRHIFLAMAGIIVQVKSLKKCKERPDKEVFRDSI